jgi:predicted acyltransferase
LFNFVRIPMMERKRLLSLDAFRGFTVAAMILVNFPGNDEQVFKPLSHTHWWGISFTDLIAPFFLFIVGVSITFAYTQRTREGSQAQTLYVKIISRAAKIFALGMVLNCLGLIGNFSWEEVRWTGTLHRIAIVFMVCSMLSLHSNWKQQIAVGATILLGYSIAMTCIPTPGYASVMLEPGINLAAWVDQEFLPGKMWQGNWDPEGILSTFPSFVTTISGMLGGTLLLSELSQEHKVIRLFAFGFAAFVIGIVWNWQFGLNENLWSSSFVMFTSGMAAMTLASTIYVVDMLQYQRWATFGIVYGMNAIVVYILGDLLSPLFFGITFGDASLNLVFYQGLTQAGMAPKLASMLYSLMFVGINFIPAYLLYKKKIFIKI